MAASEKVPRYVRLLLTSGGYISLGYPKTSFSDTELRQSDFLAQLHDWTLAQLSDVLRVIGKAPDRDFVIGVVSPSTFPGPDSSRYG